MLGSNSKIVYSELSRRVTICGVGLDIVIFRLETEDGWTLVVLSESGSSTIWDYRFPTDQAALIAFATTVEEEGIGGFLDDEPTPTRH